MRRLIALLLAFGLVLSIGGTAEAIWLEQDIGQVGNPAFTQIFEYDIPSDTYTIYGGGDDIWGNEDEFHFVYDDVPLNGDAIIQARVVDLDVTNSWSKAGVMIRDELTDISTHAFSMVSGDPRASFQHRPLSGAGSVHNTTTGPPEGVRPYWVRLTRFGDTFTGYTSPDGENWVLQGTVDIPMVSPSIGMAITSHDNALLASAKIDNLSMARSATEYTWLGGTGNWNVSTKWNPGGLPDEMSKVTVNSGTVSVTGDESAFELNINNNATVSIGSGRSLDVVGILNAASGNVTMGADSELSFAYAGGDLRTLNFSGTAAVLPSGVLSVNTLRTSGSGATFVMEGGGTLAAASASVRPDTVFSIDAGTLELHEPNALGGSTQDVQLNGGRLRLVGATTSGVDPGMPNISGLRFHVDASDIGTLFQDPAGAIPVTGGGQPVARWEDISGFNLHVSEADVAHLPDYVASVPELNNKPALHFDGGGNGDVLRAVNNGTGITGTSADCTVISVWANGVGTGQNYQHTFHMGNVSGNQSYGHSISRGGNNGEIGNHYWGDGHNFTNSGGLGEANIALSTWDADGGAAGGRDSWWINGKFAGEIERAALNIGNQQLTVGSRLNPFTEGLNGDIAEVLVYNRILTDGERDDVTFHLQQKYGILSTLPLNMTNDDFVVTGNSALAVETDSTAALGRLTLREGIITTEGTASSLSFTSTVIASDATEVGIDPRITTDWGGAISGGTVANPFVFSKGGPTTLTFVDGDLINMQNATIDAHEGTLIMLNDEAWAGSTSMMLSGGQMIIDNDSLPPIAGGPIVGTFYDVPTGNPPTIEPIDSGSGVLTQVPMATIELAQPLDFPDNSLQPYAGVPEDDFACAWTGQLIVGGGGLPPGPISFGLRSDDGSVVYIDIDGDGTFNTGNERIVGDNSDHGLNNQAGNVTLAAGIYDFAIGLYERGGGDAITARYAPGVVTDYNQMTIIDPTAANQAANFYVYGARDLSTHSVEVIADSELTAAHGDLLLGPLTMESESTLTTSGGAISFTGLTIAGDGEAFVGIEANTDTTLTGTTGIAGGDRELTIEISGNSRTVINKVGTGLENTTFDLIDGELVGLIDATGTTFGDATLSFNGGGVMLGSTGGNQTYDEPMALAGSGTFGVGEVPGAVSDVEVTYGSETNGITMDSFGVLGFKAEDGYTLQIDGAVSGAGGIAGEAGVINLNAVGAKDYAGGTTATGGTLTVNTPLANTSHIEVGNATMVLNADVTTNGGQQLGLMGSIFTGIPRDASHMTLDDAAYFGSGLRVFSGDKAGTVLTDPASHSVTVTGTTQNWAAFPTFDGNADDFVTAFSGRFIAPETGTYNWHWNNDDRGLMYIDLDDNGRFEASESVAAYAWNSNGNVDLTAGQGYNLIYMAQEFGGGQNVNWYFTPPTGTEVRVDPSQPDQSNLWISPVSSTTSVNVGALEVNAALNTGTVAVSNGGRLNVNDGGSVTATSVSIAGNGAVNVGAGGSVSAETLSILGGGVYDTQTPSTFRAVSMRGGGTMLTNGNPVTISESLKGSGYEVTVAPGGDFRVQGADLAAGIDALTLNGDVTFAGPRAPISHWTFDDGAGTTAMNSADPSFNGTLIDLGTGPLPAWTTRGKVNGAVVFDGMGYVDLPDGYADFTGGVTVAGWIYHLSLPNWGRIIDFGNGAAVDNVLLAHRGTSTDARFEFHDTAGGGELIDPNGVFTTFGWQHIVATCDDGPTNGATMKLYINGDLAFEEGGKSVPGNVVRTNNYIGESNWAGDDFFHGYMDELMIWDRELSAEEVKDLHIAGVLGQGPPDFTQVSLGGTLDGTGTLDGDLTLNGQIVPSALGGGGSGTIGFKGEARMTAETSTILTMDPAGMSQLTNAGNSDLHLNGELQYRVQGVKAADEGKDIEVAIVNSLAEGVIQGKFDVVPAGTAAAPVHIDQGVFHKGIAYQDSFPPTTPPSYFSADATFFVAGGGDANGDGRVDGQDITNLITNFSRPGDPSDRTWLRSDTAGGIFGRGDGNVDGQDITDLISNFTGDPGPADPSSMKVEYDETTGEFKVSANNLNSWNFISLGLFRTDIADPVTGVKAISDLPSIPGAFVSENINTVGEASFGARLMGTDLFIGEILADNARPNFDEFTALIESGDLKIEFANFDGLAGALTAADIGLPGQGKNITFVPIPEPSTIVMLIGGLAGLLLVWRRRRRA